MTRPGRRPSGPPYLHSVYAVLLSKTLKLLLNIHVVFWLVVVHVWIFVRN